MRRSITSYPVNNEEQVRTQLLNFGCAFSNFIFLDNHQYSTRSPFQWMAAIGAMDILSPNHQTSLAQIEGFQKKHQDWIFGHLSYDLKNSIEDLHSENEDGIGFPEYTLFVPEVVFIFSENKLHLHTLPGIRSEEIIARLWQTGTKAQRSIPFRLKSRITRDEYLKTVSRLQQHIARGDCYEVCFCQEFYAENVQLHPVSTFENIGLISPTPFAAFYKSDDKYLLCASPERFIQKWGNTLRSQPVKGTAPRDHENPIKDSEYKQQLQNSAKEQAENIMIVDLVRNDLAKICIESSVTVDEFLEIYSYPQVHQMISTISGLLPENITFARAIQALFPMGSMTGAPKKRAMELIEQYEQTRRGLYSGSVGYIAPNGDFDWNVVIRSLLYNSQTKYASIHAGSAITSKSDPEKEYEECLLKIKGWEEVLGRSI